MTSQQRCYVYRKGNIDNEIVLFPKWFYFKIIWQAIDPVNKHDHKPSVIMCATFQGNYFIKIKFRSVFSLATSTFLFNWCSSPCSLPFHLHHSHLHPLSCFPLMLYYILFFLQFCNFTCLKKHVHLYMATTYKYQ